MQSPPDEWTPSNDWNDKKTWFAGSPQSLTGDLIREGATGVAGHVAEPYLQSTIRPEILFPAYFGGFNLIESFYLAMPHLSWQTVVIGDPLCVPFPRSKPLTRADLEDPIHTQTEFPGLFAQRRIERGRVALVETPPEAVMLLLLSESRLARNDSDGAALALEEATKLAPSLQAAQVQLGVLYGQAGQTAKSLELYRTILKTQPNNLVALNNMAYLLAVDLNTPKDGLPFAIRAASIAPEDPNVLDTLGWVQHLLGNDAEASKHFAEAVRRGTANVEIRVHAAIVFAAVGAYGDAEAQVKEAIRLDPLAARRVDVLNVRKLLANLPK
jgi:tetratricopeptide (TPR) repeat protein